MAGNSFNQEFLETHNVYRRKHGVASMTYSDELNKSAQKWADHLLSLGQLQHSGSQDGENIFFMSSSGGINLTGKEAVDSWYSEIKDYTWNSPGFSNSTGHFTQVVWKESTQLGVGMATDGTKAYVVGQYRPAGNTRERFPENVLPPGLTFSMCDTSYYDRNPVCKFTLLSDPLTICTLSLIGSSSNGDAIPEENGLNKGCAFYRWKRGGWSREHLQ